MNFKSLLVIGPTASGKTAFAHQLADWLVLNGRKAELVNLDAFQIYKGVTAGTAKPTSQEIVQYHYHGIDIVEPHESLDARDFASKAHAWCEEIWKRGNYPICVGGSGLYLRAFLHGLDDLPSRDETLRAFFRGVAAEEGWPRLHSWLQALDPVRASELHPNDGVRIERALEIFFITGEQPSRLRSKANPLGEQMCLFPSYVVHIKAPEALLKERIRQRVEDLFKGGWLEEVQGLTQKHGASLRDFPSMRAIGYPEVLHFLNTNEEKGSVVDLQERVSTLTWQYARRQSTWNAKEKKDVETIVLRTLDLAQADSIVFDNILSFFASSPC